VTGRPVMSMRRSESQYGDRADIAARARIGVVPIIWNNADLGDLGPPVPPGTVLDEIARLGYAGTQFGVGFPNGDQLAALLAARAVRVPPL